MHAQASLCGIIDFIASFSCFVKCPFSVNNTKEADLEQIFLKGIMLGHAHNITAGNAAFLWHNGTDAAAATAAAATQQQQ